MKCTALRGKPGAMIDACIHLVTIDNLHMQFNYQYRELNMCSSVSVYKQQCSYLHDGLKNLYQYVFHENWDINSKVITVGGLK